MVRRPQDPQPFSLEELLAHFEAIAQAAGAFNPDEETEGADGGSGGAAAAASGTAKDASAGSVLNQVAGLLAHGLITACTQEPLDGPRYRSLVRCPFFLSAPRVAQSCLSQAAAARPILLCTLSCALRHVPRSSQVGDGLAQRVATNLKIDLPRHLYCDT